MTSFTPIPRADLHQGTFGYVLFKCLESPQQPKIMILCEVFGVRKNRELEGKWVVEAVPIACDRACLYVDSSQIYTKSER